MVTIDWKNAAPNELNAWRGYPNVALYPTIQPLFTQLPIAASEFLIYAGNKLYFALELHLSAAGAVSMATEAVEFRDPVNGAWFFACNMGSPDPIMANMLVADIVLKNIFFSRFIVTSYTFMKFNGYRLIA